MVYSGTFAKVLAPALRLGFLLAPAGLASAFEAARALADRQPPVPEQAVLAHFIAEDHLATHLRRMRVLYVERRDALLRALEAECAGLLAWEPRDVGAGLHLTVMFRDPAVDGVAVSEAAARIGVQAPPLNTYALGRGRARLVLAFAATPAERMVDATHRLRCAAGVAVGG